ncbi:hypothetical protein [Staphylococcus pasteuri]|uniref:hypothetical protein n=1 Tax=Staphylococcus pasteuri TaxID=45972 RepID=UPI000F836572|nr:hypothetical protein [Staphylococcus pasteuri]QQN53290.1 hypothetical protein I6I26_07880 [Staphylococcus pasteuri]RTX70641.1 hypothetical protein CD121_11480 [Staphylococcus pasteuri]
MLKQKHDNHLYSSLKHCNAFLSRREDFRNTTQLDVQENESKVSKFQKEMNYNAFEHTSDIFKKAKENLRTKGEL